MLLLFYRASGASSCTDTLMVCFLHFVAFLNSLANHKIHLTVRPLSSYRASGARTEAEAHSPHVCTVCIFQGMCVSAPVARWHTRLLRCTPHLYVSVIHTLWASICDIAASTTQISASIVQVSASTVQVSASIVQVSASIAQVSTSKARFRVYIARFREPMSPHNRHIQRTSFCDSSVRSVGFFTLCQILIG